MTARQVPPVSREPIKTACIEYADGSHGRGVPCDWRFERSADGHLKFYNSPIELSGSGHAVAVVYKLGREVVFRQAIECEAFDFCIRVI